jgi:hypothetical protein
MLQNGYGLVVLLQRENRMPSLRTLANLIVSMHRYRAPLAALWQFIHTPALRYG